jgi:alpha-1,4-galacturonosyltransferase
MEEKKNSPRLTHINLYHFCVFSNNVLATSVVVNSTTYHAELLVFHIVMDGVNFGAMQAWFAINRFKGETIEVQNVDDLTWLNASYVPVLKQLQDAETQNYYFTGAQDSKSTIKFFTLLAGTECRPHALETGNFASWLTYILWFN